MEKQETRITSLQIDWYNNGLTCGEFVVHQVVSVYRNKRQIIYRGYNALSKEPQESFDVRMDTASCEALFSLLEKSEAARDFEQDFIVEVCDGSAWDMRLRHSDNRITLIKGTVEYPTHGEEIEEYIRTAIEQTLTFFDPMIFGCRVYDEDEREEDK